MESQLANQPLEAKDYAVLLDEINFMHSFREGNGRSCKVFLLAYAANHGQVTEYPLENEKMIEAQIETDIGEISQLLNIENNPSRNQAFELLASLHDSKRNEESIKTKKNKKLES